MPYNLSLVANSSGIVPLIQNVNSELMQNMFGILLLISLWIITFMAFVVTTGGNGMRAAAASSFFAFVAALFLRGIGIVPDLALAATLILAAISIFFIKRI